MGSAPLRITGGPGSPYTCKMLALLRYRRIAHRYVIRGSREDHDTPPVRVPIIPVLSFPDGEGGFSHAKVDSTPLIRELEELYPGRSVIPGSPALAFLDQLLEDYADEWVSKIMYHYRWAFDHDAKLASQVVPLPHLGVDTAREVLAELGGKFGERQVGRRWVVGSNETTRPTIEQSYRRLLGLLDDHFCQHRFLMGARPGSSDFALYGQLSQLVWFDPTSRTLAEELSPRTMVWVQLMEDLSGLEPAQDGWLDSDALPETLQALLLEVGRVLPPFFVANGAAVASGAEQLQCAIDGRPWVQRPVPYQAKCLGWLRQAHGALEESVRARVDAVLSGTGCEALFAVDDA